MDWAVSFGGGSLAALLGLPAALLLPVWGWVIALLVAVAGPWLAGWSWLAATYNALVLLVIACPCALVISTPVTVVSGLAAAARRGILIKGGVYLEEARKLRVVAVDKTGTVTQGQPKLVAAEVLPDGTGAALARVVVERRAGRFLQLEEQEVGKRGLGALDLGREHRLTPDVGIEEKVRIRQQGADAVQPPDGERGPFQPHLPGPGNLQGRHGRQGQRHKRPHLFPSGRGHVVGAGGVAFHGLKLE